VPSQRSVLLLGDVIAPWWARFMTIRAQDPNMPRDPNAPWIEFTHRVNVPNALGFHEADKGGHFAAWEEPLLFASEMRAAFKSLR
jgi:pimeloyl-ACP methyl ester carboxylesterase